MSRFFTWLERLATPRRVTILFVLELAVIACENLLTFPVSAPYMQRATGHAYLDMCAFCSASDVYGELSAFGEVGRRLQLWLLATVDLLIPPLSGLFGASALTLFTRDLRVRTPGRRLLALVPVAATLLDFAENLGIATLTSNYPERFDALATLTGFTTGIKFLAYASTLLAVVVLGALRLLRVAPPPAAPAPRT